MSDENKSLQERVENEFINSQSVKESVVRLMTEPTIAIIRRVVGKFIGLIISMMDKMLAFLGIALTEPDKIYENAEKGKEKAKLISVIMLKILDDPEIKQNIKELAIALNDSALKPFLAIAIITMKQMTPALKEAQDQLIEQMKEGLKRAGDGAWDAAENVISGIPGFGNAWSAFSGIMSVVQAGQNIVDMNVKVILEITYRLIKLVRKVNVPGLNALDSFLDVGLKSYKFFTDIAGKFDKFTAAMTFKKYVPNEGLTKESIAKTLKEQDEEANKMAGDVNLEDAMNTSPESPENPKEPSKDEKEPSKDEKDPSKDEKDSSKDQKDPSKDQKKSKKKKKKGGSRRKKIKNIKKRTKKRSLK